MDNTKLGAGADYPRTFEEMDDWFRTEAGCRDYIRRLRWPDGFGCGYCGVIGEPWVMARGVLRGKACHGHTSLTAGTVFQATRKPWRTWVLAMWFTTRQTTGVSALGLQRVLGRGSDETAWMWMLKLRRAMVRPGRARLPGEVEEPYGGGPEEGKRGRASEKKSIVVVAAEKNGRGIGRIRLQRVKDVSAEHLRDFIRETVDPGRDNPYRRVGERLCRPDGCGLHASCDGHRRQGRTCSRSQAARSSRRRAAQGVAARNAPGRSSTTASR